MAISAKYRFVTLGTPGTSRPEDLRRTIRRRIADLGLDPTNDVDFPSLDDVATLDCDRQPVVAAFFGALDRSPALDAAADALTARGVLVLPVVEGVSDYKDRVPACLHELNAHVVADADEGLESVAQRVLEEVRLLRDKRLVFVSYRRADAAAIAEQLYRVFDERAFDVFLDTHSVRSGLPFQSVLWDQIADADVLVLLDSPKALSSRWVQQELNQASSLGLEVLQVIWPGHFRMPGTDFCHPLRLEPTDFDNPKAFDDPATQLSEATAHRVATLVEALRARSIAARRTRIIGDLQRQATAAGFTMRLQPAQFIDMTRSGKDVVRVYPVVGHPDSRQVHFCHDGCGTDRVEGTLLYDPLGMQPVRSAHIAWLNGFLPLKAVPVTELRGWLATLP